jgi:lysophospholipase L1-like esterase
MFLSFGMQILMWVSLIIAAILVCVELGARLYHFLWFRVPFRSRVIAEYPYEQFTEKDDPPFYFRLKKGYRSHSVNINQQGMRGPELRNNPDIRRAMFLGESHFFGVKLFHEDDLWSFHLQQHLDKLHKHDKTNNSEWEILNFSFPGYNTSQYKAFFEHELCALKPEFLAISIGGNDITQARMFGEKWYPNMPYPFEFIHALARRSSRVEKWLNRSCFFFLWRRKYQENKRKSLFNERAVFKKEECFQTALKNIEAIAEMASKHGIEVFYVTLFPVYELNMTAANKRKITSIQSNWESYLKIDGPPIFEFIEKVKSDLGVRLNMPVIDLRPRFWCHPKRFELFFDLYHLNTNGMKLLADYLYEEIDAQGYWKKDI